VGGQTLLPDDQHHDNESDTAFNRIVRGVRTERPRLEQRERRLQGIELLIVLSIFPLGAALAAAAAFAYHLQTGLNAWDVGLALGLRGTWVPLLFVIAEVVAQIGAAALVFYLLVRSGEGLSAINLGGRRLRMDLALVLPVFLVVFLIPQWFGISVMSWADVHTFQQIGLDLSPPARFAVYAVRGISAGILEEVVVLGYLVRRLQMRGMSVPAIVAIEVVVRLSYHVYYGPGIIPIALWAIVCVLVYLRIQRLLPFIIAHAAYDVGLAWRYTYHDSYLIVAATLAVLSAAFTLGWIRWSPEPTSAPDDLVVAV